MDWQKVMEGALTAVREADVFIDKHFGKVESKDIEEKELNSLVSFVDKGAEEILVSELSKVMEGCGFVTEEDTPDNPGAESVWIIDPLDGTTNFLNQVPHFAISVALQHKGETVLGIVKEVNSKEEWTAIAGSGAQLNGRAINVTSKSFEDVLIATGFPYRNDYAVDRYFNIIKYWLMNSRGMRRMGSAALDLCYVACGRFGAYYEANLNSWDVAAGALIVQEAGGKVTDFGGGNDFNSGQQIIATAPQFYQKVQENIEANLSELIQ